MDNNSISFDKEEFIYTSNQPNILYIQGKLEICIYIQSKCELVIYVIIMNKTISYHLEFFLNYSVKFKN